jgi:hypothetical protein
MAADQNPPTPSPIPEAPGADAQTPSTAPVELTDAQLDTVSGGVGAMQMAGGMQMSKAGALRALGDSVSWGDPHEKVGGS